MHWFDKNLGQYNIAATAELRSYKKHINNLMSLWLGMPRDIDWVETIIYGKDVKIRD